MRDRFPKPKHAILCGYLGMLSVTTYLFDMVRSHTLHLIYQQLDQ